MALNQLHYRFGINELTESTHSWLTGEDRDCNRMVGAAGQFLLRFSVQSVTLGLNNVDFEYQFRLTPKATGTPGNWTNITSISSVVRTGSTTVFTNGQDCTKRLSGTGTFVANNDGCTHDGTTGGNNNDIPTNGNSECEIGLQIIGTDVAVGDLIEFRLTRDGGILLDSYVIIPSIRVAVEVLTSNNYDNTAHNSITASVTKINGTQVNVECFGMSFVDLADSTLSINMSVWGTTIIGSTDPLDYTVPLYGPDVWVGGVTGKDGLPVKPGFTFAADFSEDIKRVMAKFQPNKTVTFGAQATILEI